MGRRPGSKNKPKENKSLASPGVVGYLNGKPRKFNQGPISEKAEENGEILSGAKKLLYAASGRKKELNPELKARNQELREAADSYKEPFLDEMEKFNGRSTYAAKELGIYYATVRRWYKDDADFRKRFDDLRAMRVDVVEDALMTNIEKGKEISSIFFLKCQGKDRGWVEKQEVNHTGTIVHAHGIIADEKFVPRFIQLLAEASGAGTEPSIPVIDSDRPLLPDTVCIQQDGLRQRLAVSEVQGRTERTGRDVGPMGEGTPKVYDYNLCEDDTGHSGEPGHNGGDIQPHPSDGQELLEADKEGT